MKSARTFFRNMANFLPPTRWAKKSSFHNNTILFNKTSDIILFTLIVKKQLFNIFLFQRKCVTLRKIIKK